jgi:hypothetical protein
MSTSPANCFGIQTIGLIQETRMPSVWHLANQLAPVLRSGVIEMPPSRMFHALLYSLR